MPVEIRMPALSPTMEEGTLSRWLIKEGDTVQSGDVIAEIETDKATMEFEAADDGIVGRILVTDGTAGVAVNTPIALLLEEGEPVSAIQTPHAPVADKAPLPAPNADAMAPSAEQASQYGTKSRIFASPLARRLATEKGIDLNTLAGSGPRGRIVKADVEQAKSDPRPHSQPARRDAVPADAPKAPDNDIRPLYADRSYVETALDGMRKTVAARLTEAKQTIPHFYLRRDIRIDALLSLRKQLNQSLDTRGVKLSINDFIIKACALALQQVPAANAVWAGDAILRMHPSDVAVAVAVEGGLFTPVLRDAETKTLSALSTEMKDLAARARERKLKPAEYQGGSFAISNLGMYGIDNFDAVINPPHGSILAVGAGKRKPVVQDDGELGSATIVSVTLSADHRVIDGAVGAEFLSAIADYLEHPLAILA
ncbi:MAG: pyruvate dehydrogenase complex dihydrolipoamide acetyltransferase [Pseudoprimorskyibacter sp.]|nr:pyruvate dehydrogenase complex dihydrolipoamide acetyltransferase [Pseudoprimorskyibacter sp.]